MDDASAAVPPAAGIERLRAEVRGAVQGVGFRPFVYRLATELELKGWVTNDTRGVFVEVEGPRGRLESFLERLSSEAPRVATLHSVEHAWLAPEGFARFEIRHADGDGARTAVLLPDLATCPECLVETRAPGRREGYPFTNCTNCGPRFSIIRDLPYDRPNTSVSGFAMCADCAREYADPLDRRFHAQPIACPRCGPRISYRSPFDDLPPALRSSSDAAALDAAVNAVLRGDAIALKGLGGYQIVCDATDERAVRRLREAKGRAEKPFAVLCADVAEARTLCRVDEAAAAVLESPECPIVLLPLVPAAPVAPSVAPQLSQLGVMLPATPLHHLLCARLGRPLVATSGNLSEEPIVTDDDDARARLGHMVAGVLSHDRPIVRHVDDSVGWFVGGEFRLLRRARGYAPLPVRVRGEWPVILAAGAHLKNTIALAVRDQVFLSQHVGDLETEGSLRAFERVIEDFLRMYRVTPEAIAHDLHPDYLSTQWAREAAGRFGVPLVGVQHHHAHLAACLAEHGAEGPALGVIWDGTGWGPDGTVWGGEFLLGDASGFERVAHLRPFRLPGGEAAVREPARAAAGALREVLGPGWVERRGVRATMPLGAQGRIVIEQMLAAGLNSPVTTSAGRLFDALAALAGLYQPMSFEGQAAMHFEALAEPGDHGAYPVELRPPERESAPMVVDWAPMVATAADDAERKVAPGLIAARAHGALVRAIAEVAARVGVGRVVLSGGCFQNRRLTEGVIEELSAAGHEVLIHRLVPPNDGAVSLGQAAVAAARLRGEPR